MALNLNDLIKQQKGQSNGPAAAKPNDNGRVDGATRAAPATVQPAAAPDRADQSGTESAQRVDAAPAPASGGSRLAFLNRVGGSQGGQPTPNDDAGGPVSGADDAADSAVAAPKGLAFLAGRAVASTPAKVDDVAPKAAPIVPTGSGGTFSLADLDSYEAPSAPDPFQQYADMIPADLPDRPLPDDITPQQLEFVQLVESTYHILNEPEAFGQVIRNMMAELSENPEYDKLIVDADINAMMRGMRGTMGLAQIKKASNKRGASKKAPSEKAISLATGAAELDNMFGDGAFD